MAVVRREATQGHQTINHTTMNTQTTRVNYELTARIIANGSKPTTKQAQKRNWEVISAVSILAILVGSVLLAVHYGLINNGI